MNNITILELHNPIEVSALTKAIHARLDTLQDGRAYEEIGEYLALYRLATRLVPHVVEVPHVDVSMETQENIYDTYDNDFA
jgi:hypothetical protein